MNRVKDKVAVITGASLGIGHQTAVRLAEEGAKVAITDVNDAAGTETANQINKNGGIAAYWHLDVSKEADVIRVISEIGSKWGKIDILVNNAGISGANKSTEDVTEEEWDKLMSINVKGVFFCTKHTVPFLRKAGGGSIINLSSIYGLIGAGDVSPYHASKGAVREMSKNDAISFAKDKIRVNSVHPGFIWTPMVENFAKETGAEEQARKALNALHPLGHIGEPNDIAWGIVYLASDEAKFVTGSELVIDGGYTAR
jgi:NAD(P)-dependent dehydrogenase (short-subunit alcohol dehydrogenase family)